MFISSHYYYDFLEQYINAIFCWGAPEKGIFVMYRQGDILFILF